MATIKPFSCIRPACGLEKKIAALPYDVCDRREARIEINQQPLSFLKIDKAESLLDDSVDPYDDKVYQKASEVFNDMINDGSFQKDPEMAMYLYELTMDGRSQSGLVCCSAIDDYLNGIIMKHENTRTDKENDRIRHIDTLSAQTGPIFLAYRPNDKINEITSAIQATVPYFDFTSDDGIRHRGWKINDKSILDEVISIFASIHQIYIADGHHRAASAVRVGQRRRKSVGTYTGQEEFNYFLSVLFPEDQLYIMDYNRVVHDLGDLTEDTFTDALLNDFDITPVDKAYRPKGKGEFGMYLGGHWYRLISHSKLHSTDPVDGLDVSILQNYILAPHLGIIDPKTDQRISFIGGIRGLEELERVCAGYPHAVAFSMFPTSADELFAVADAGRLMPPKSTWFEPKLRSGLFIHEIEKI